MNGPCLRVQVLYNLYIFLKLLKISLQFVSVCKCMRFCTVYTFSGRKEWCIQHMITDYSDSERKLAAATTLATLSD